MCIVRVRRHHLVEDALAEVSRQLKKDLFKPLRVHFIGEEGIDAGGVKKELFQLLMTQLLSPDYGMLTHQQESNTYWWVAGWRVIFGMASSGQRHGARPLPGMRRSHIGVQVSLHNDSLLAPPTCRFDAGSLEAEDQYLLLGLVLGLAVYNRVLLDFPLPLALYKKLLGLPVGLRELEDMQPTFGRSLRQLIQVCRREMCRWTGGEAMMAVIQ